MKCKEKDCGGEVELGSDKAVTLKVGCGSRRSAYPCGKCGSLHFGDGSPVVTRAGENVFLIDEKIVKKKVKPSASSSQQMSIEL